MITRYKRKRIGTGSSLHTPTVLRVFVTLFVGLAVTLLIDGTALVISRKRFSSFAQEAFDGEHWLGPVQITVEDKAIAKVESAKDKHV